VAIIFLPATKWPDIVVDDICCHRQQYPEYQAAGKAGIVGHCIAVETITRMPTTGGASRHPGRNT
jgi:hypothetical protein